MMSEYGKSDHFDEKEGKICDECAVPIGDNVKFDGVTRCVACWIEFEMTVFYNAGIDNPIPLELVDTYTKLPYKISINLVEEEDGTYYFYGKIVELDGCHTTANNIEELLAELENVKKDHIEIKLQNGDPMPFP